MTKEDVVLTPAGSVSDIKPSNSVTTKPIYLVLIEEGTKRSLRSYLALKVEKQDSYVEFKGHVYDGPVEGLDPHSLFNLSKTEEIIIPWSRVVQIKNLSFKSLK